MSFPGEEVDRQLCRDAHLPHPRCLRCALSQGLCAQHGSTWVLLLSHLLRKNHRRKNRYERPSWPMQERTEGTAASEGTQISSRSWYAFHCVYSLDTVIVPQKSASWNPGNQGAVISVDILGSLLLFLNISLEHRSLEKREKTLKNELIFLPSS